MTKIIKLKIFSLNFKAFKNKLINSNTIPAFLSSNVDMVTIFLIFFSSAVPIMFVVGETLTTE